jgi:pyruvate/2-oxoacid:ferredoxin oxidoreductase alpha subunit
MLDLWLLLQHQVQVYHLKSEAIGLAVMTELPLIIVDVQRGGPSTGLPTKSEQADLLQVFTDVMVLVHVL